MFLIIGWLFLKTKVNNISWGKHNQLFETLLKAPASPGGLLEVQKLRCSTRVFIWTRPPGDLNVHKSWRSAALEIGWPFPAAPPAASSWMSCLPYAQPHSALLMCTFLFHGCSLLEGWGHLLLSYPEQLALWQIAHCELSINMGGLTEWIWISQRH